MTKDQWEADFIARFGEEPESKDRYYPEWNHWKTTQTGYLAGREDGEKELATALSDAKHVRQANENYRQENAIAVANLEASQLQNVQLREALKSVRVWFSTETMMGMGMVKTVDGVLALPTDPSALEAALEEARAEERARIDDLFMDALQSDLEHGVKCLNEKAAEEFKQRYPAISAFPDALRNLGKETK